MVINTKQEFVRAVDRAILAAYEGTEVHCLKPNGTTIRSNGVFKPRGDNWCEVAPTSGIQFLDITLAYMEYFVKHSDQEYTEYDVGVRTKICVPQSPIELFPDILIEGHDLTYYAKRSDVCISEFRSCEFVPFGSLFPQKRETRVTHTILASDLFRRYSVVYEVRHTQSPSVTQSPILDEFPLEDAIQRMVTSDPFNRRSY